jgi:uncharacterized membrane protein YphA (DoxX/SURF4 family)
MNTHTAQPFMRIRQMTRLHRSPTTLLRVLFGVVWLVGAFFKWQPGFRDSFAAILQGMVSSQPGIVKPWFQFWALIATHTGHLLPDGTAVTETALGIALIVGFARRCTSWAACTRSPFGQSAKDSGVRTRWAHPPMWERR